MKTYGLALLVLCLLACRNTDKFARIKDAELEIMATPIKDKTDSALVYKVRIFPAKSLLEAHKAILNESMSYHSDSLFYVVDGGKRIYADQIEPIANGINGCFEYLVVFDVLKTGGINPDLLIYQDKFINQKRYELSLK